MFVIGKAITQLNKGEICYWDPATNEFYNKELKETEMKKELETFVKEFCKLDAGKDELNAGEARRIAMKIAKNKNLLIKLNNLALLVK